MITIENIISELNSAPEPLLAEVLTFIRGVRPQYNTVVRQQGETHTG